MLNGNKDYKRIKAYCRKHFNYSTTRKRGCDVDMKTICGHLSNLGLDAYISGDGTTIQDITKYNKALCLWTYKKETYGHAMVWDGSGYLDPGFYNPKKYSERTLPKMHYNHLLSSVAVIIIRTHPLKRLLNRIKKPFIDLFY